MSSGFAGVLLIRFWLGTITFRMERQPAMAQETVDGVDEDMFHVEDGAFEDGSADEGELELEDTNRYITVAPDKNDRSLAEFHRWYKRKRLVVDPEWQREYVWDRNRASRLIESFLIDLPVPVVYLAINSEGNYEVIDGLQRLTSVFDYFDNKYALTSLSIRKDVNGKKFSDLEKAEQDKLEDSTLRTFELPAATRKDLMFLIFERLNTGGLALNDMEIRNCLYRGELNNLVKRLAQRQEFSDAVHQKNLNRRMTDRTLVLRYLAFYQMTYTKAKKGLKAFINEFFETYRNPSPDKLDDFERQFLKSMKASQTVFGDNAFRLRAHRERTRGGEWGSRINASVFQVISVSFTEYDLGALTRASDRIFEAYVDLIETDAAWTEAVSKSTGDPTKIEYSFETWNKRLREIMKTYPSNDTVRTFSRQLKRELYEQNKVCAICGNDIRLQNDAAIDHIKHYWRGGETIPENARLVHRHCNSVRPH